MVICCRRPRLQISKLGDSDWAEYYSLIFVRKKIEGQFEINQKNEKNLNSFIKELQRKEKLVMMRERREIERKFEIFIYGYGCF